MHVSTAQEAILERIGHTLVDVNEDITTAPLPAPMVKLFHKSRQPDETNIICALVEALLQPELYRFIDRDGELFLYPIEPD